MAAQRVKVAKLVQIGTLAQQSESIPNEADAA
jgi:hypothetical protein